MKNRIFCTGDTHSTIDINKLKKSNWEDGYTLNKNDILIIAGDFGFLWNYKRTKDEVFWLKWLEDRPWTTCFLDGNHENFDLLDNLQRKVFMGDEVGIVSHSVFHLLRGRVYNFYKELKILTIGGAHSHDRQYRTWGKSMWRQEEITEKDIELSIKNLIKHNNKVDYIISHTAPVEFVTKVIPLSMASTYSPDHSEEFLSLLNKEPIEYKRHFFGHYHVDSGNEHEKFQCLYNDIVELF